jgi:hypothetical protein
MNKILVLKQKLSTFALLAPGQRFLVVEAMFSLAIARVWLVAVPFRRVAQRLGEPHQPGSKSAESDATLLASEELAARSVGTAVRRAAANAPFRAVCIQQAVAAKLMLKRRSIPSVLHFGVAKSEAVGEPFRAHAWLNVIDIPVTGYPVGPDMVEIAYFV